MDGVASVAIIAGKTSLLILVISALSGVLAGRSAALRHCLWTCALVWSLLMPLAVVVLPAFAVIPASWAAAVQSVFGAAAPIEALSTGLIEEPGRYAATPTAAMILTLWCAGVLLCLLRDVLAASGLRRWVRRAVPLESPQWMATLQRVSHQSPLARSVRVLESTHVASPCTWGFLRPVLLLPRAGAEWPEARRRHALLHELAHIRRCDYLTLRVARLACAMHWYNPLAWFAASQARRLQEEACDDAVLRAGERPSDYAECLLSIAAQVNRLPYGARLAIGMFHRSPLRDRIAAILRPRTKHSPVGVLALLTTAVPVSCLMWFVAAVAVAEPPVSGKSVHSVVSLFAGDTEPAGAARAAAPAVRLAPHERQRLEVLPAVTPAPVLPEIAPLPPLPAVPAVPAAPPVPAELPMLAKQPELPELPELPALPALPSLPSLPDESSPT